MKKLVFCLLIISFAGCSVPHRRPQAKVVDEFTEEIKRSIAIKKLIIKAEGLAKEDYLAIIEKEAAFISTLNDLELEAYEKYTKIMYTASNQATIEKSRRELSKSLSLEKLKTAQLLYSDKLKLENYISNTYNDEERLTSKVREANAIIDNMQYHHRLTSADYEEIERLRTKIQDLRILGESIKIKYTNLTVLYDLLKKSKSFVRLTFQGNGPHGRDNRWIDDLKYGNGKFSKKPR